MVNTGGNVLNICERDVLIWLSSIGIANHNISKLSEEFTDLRNLWYCNRDDLKSLGRFNNPIIDKILKNRNDDCLKRVLNDIESKDIKIITFLDEGYPRHLINIDDKPNVIYMKGDIFKSDDLAISIVGSRKSTNYGKWAAEKFSKELVGMGITIISGLANGIDTIAHRTALDNNGRTIAVLGTGIDKIYPSKNKQLYKDVTESGAVITEFPPGTEPFPYNFPQRNRIISGLSLGIIVIEAQEKSGSLITATHASNQGRDVFALPGNINSLFSRGTNRLIKDGARPLLDIEDILEEIYELRELKYKSIVKAKVNIDDFSEIEIKIINCIEKQPIHCDEISYKTGINISELNSILTILELKGIIKELSSRIFTIC